MGASKAKRTALRKDTAAEKESSMKPGPKPSIRVEIEIATPPAFGPLDEWRRVEMERLTEQPLKPLPGGRIVAVKIAAGAPEQSRSAYPIVEPLITLLVACDIIDEEVHIASVVAGWDRTVAIGRTRMSVWTTTDPRRRQTSAGRRRIGAATSMRNNAAQAGA